MARPPVLAGELREGGAIELLRELEQKRITGVLRFESDAVAGEILLYGGEIAVEQTPRDDGRDPVDLLLELGPSRYEVDQRLPPLSVSRGDDRVKRGSLAVHVAADLMSYCEHAGLTGTLELRHEEHRAEAIYEAGELLAIELDGRGEADLSEVFRWDQGSFRIEVDLDAPARSRDADEAPTLERPAAPKREDTRQFLRVVEMALADVVQESEKARSPTRTSPPLPPPPEARPLPGVVSAPKPRTDRQTVRLIYLGGDPPDVRDDPSTRHVGKGDAELALTEARPERRRAPLPERPAMADETNDDATSSDTNEPPAPAEANKATDAKKGKSKSAASKTAASKEGDASQAAPRDAESKKASSKAVSNETDSKASSNEPESKAASANTDDEAPTEAGAPSTPAGAPVAPWVTVAGASAWAVGFVLVALAILAVLARLPPVQ